MPVTGEDVRPAHLDLAIGGEAHLLPGESAADAAHAPFRRRHTGDHGGAFSGAVAFHDGDAHRLPFSADHGIEGGAAAEEVVQLPTEAAEDGAKHDAPGGAGQPRCDAAHAGDQLRLPLGGGLPLDAVHEQRPDLGDAHDDRRFPLLHEAEKGRRLAAGGIGDGGAPIERDEAASHLFEHVAEREQREHPGAGIDGGDRATGLSVRGDVAVRQHHALGVAGGARGVDDLGEGVPRQRGHRDAAVDDEVERLELDRGHFKFAQDVKLGVAGEGEARLRLRDDARDKVLAAAHIKGHDNTAGDERAEHRGHPIGVVP